MKRILTGLWLASCAAAFMSAAQSAAPAASATPEKTADGLVLPVAGGFLQLQVKTDAIIRVTFAKERDFRADNMVVVGPAHGVLPADVANTTVVVTPAPQWTYAANSTAATLTTARLKATVALADGAVTFTDPSGQIILAETPGAHLLTPVTVQGEQTFNVQQTWQANADESLYGLGQRQEGMVDIKGFDQDLWQRNTVVVVPFLVSSRGYGILWDNTAFTRFGNLRPFEAIPAADLVDAAGQPGGLSTGTLAAGADQLTNPTHTAVIDRAAGGGGRGGRGGRGGAAGTRAWMGEVVAPVTGDYQLQAYSNGAIKVWFNNQVVMDHWRQGWLTEYDLVKVHLEAGQHYPIKITSGGDQVSTMQFTWKTPSPSADTSLWSEVGEGIDYYFVYGPDIDQVIAGYRQLTGEATMPPQWAFGLWQSRQRYENQQQLLDVVAQFRQRQIPFDNIVQDWRYWADGQWGTHQFDPSRFPDPVGMLKTVHDEHSHLMISVWGKFYPNTDNYKALAAINAVYLPTITENIKDWLNTNYTFYDAFNPAARKMFWGQLDTALFSKGVDAWWMDASEPDVVQPSPPTLEKTKHYIGVTAAGTASRVLNGYALENSEGMYQGQRASAPNQRVFILTRSGFAGEQRYGTVTWSGDVTSTWTALRKQIAGGLGFSISGTPYWTTDTGGYTLEARFNFSGRGTPNAAALDEWRELNDRWFQFSTFCPILRVHGEINPREMWNIGDDSTPVYQSELKYDKLRYALFPYTYSVAGAVTQDGYTLMRPLVMDFRNDLKARDITDQYMFGPDFLVNPVTVYQARSRSVHLPAGTDWYDFWTGQKTGGGQTVTADAAYDKIPLYVRAGAIIPVGPDVQYVGEKPADHLTLYVYPGANGQFSLYEDDGLTYDYEKGAFARIPIKWDDATKTLTIGPRAGSFKGMPGTRTFNVVVVSANQPAGYSPTPPAGKSVAYTGAPVTTKF